MHMRTNTTAAEQRQQTDSSGAVLLDAKQVAQILKCSRRTVYRLAQAGRIPPPCRLGALARWSSLAIEAWIAAGCPKHGKS